MPSISILFRISQERNRFDLCCCFGLRDPSLGRELGQESYLYSLFKNFYSPFLLSEWIRPSIIVIFIGWLCASVGEGSTVCRL